MFDSIDSADHAGSMKRPRSTPATRRRARALIGAQSILSGLLVALGGVGPANRAEAYSYSWSQVEHNIQGARGNTPGQWRKAQYFVDSVQAAKPIGAAALEVCRSQADYIYRELIGSYHFYFTVAKQRDDKCINEGTGRSFGNVTLVSKAAVVSFDTSRSGFQSGPYESGFTLVFRHQASTVEHKRADCVYVTGGTTAARKFAVCSTHLASISTGKTGDQFGEIVWNPGMGADHLFLGDFNLEPWFMSAQVPQWEWDAAQPYPYEPIAPTTSSRKIDWVLGRGSAQFKRTAVSQPYGFGVKGYESDHRLLHALVKPT